MNKNELLKMLEEGLKIEESLIPIYTRHISNTLFLSEFTEKKREEIKTALSSLRNDSEVHREIYLRLLEKTRGEDRDVY